jgi:hypothetical protein
MKSITPLRFLNIEGDGLHLALTIRINGKPANMILDTGASKTVFDFNKVSAYLKTETLTENESLSTGLGTNTMMSQRINIQKLQVGKITVSDYGCVVLDLSHVNTAYEQIGLKPIIGVLGSDFLHQYNAVIDYGKKKLFLTEKKKAKKKTK